MDNIAGKIELFHNLYLGFLAGTIIFLMISIFLFIRLNIKDVIGFFTGHQAKREIRALEQIGMKTKVPERYMSPEIQSGLGIQKEDDSKIRKAEVLKGITVTKRLADGSEEVTELLQQKGTESKETTILHQEKQSFYIEREVLLIHANEIIG